MDSTRLIALTACLLASHAQAQILNEDHKLLASDGESSEEFGYVVACSGTVAVISAPDNDGMCSPADFSAWVANSNAGC